MYYNGNNRYRVSTFLNQVHTAMQSKYIASASIDKQNALELQNFFQELKEASLTYDPNNPIGNEVINLVLDGVIKHSPPNFKIANLFGQAGKSYGKNAYDSGARFERELTRVIQAVYEGVSDKEFKFDESQVNIGSRTATSINLSEELLGDQQIQKMLKTVGTKTQKYITMADGTKKLVYYLQDVSGKIDVKGYEIAITGNPSPELLKIYNLLKDATFTAKNYNSKTWDEKAQTFVDATGTTLALGKTNIYRSIIGTLEDLGYDSRTSQSAFWAGFNRINSGDQNVMNHFYHLRYIYELTGAGIKYDGQSYGGAKYLIYNDPSGGIWVKSTAEILADLLNSSDNITSGIYSKIVIDKDIVSKG